MDKKKQTPMARNLTAKHARKYNRSSVFVDRKKESKRGKKNIKVKTMNIYEICKNEFRYFLKVNDKVVKCFDTYDEAFYYCVEHANAD